MAGSFPPPPTLAETDDGPLWAPFFFWFQRGLAVATALRRLAKYPKSVSERHLSLIDRPRLSEGRFQNSVYLQMFGDFDRAPFSKVQPIAKFVSNPRDGRRTVGSLNSEWIQIRLGAEHVPAPSCSFQLIRCRGCFDEGIGVFQMVMDKRFGTRIEG